MAYLNRQQILEANDLPTEDVPTPEWGGTVKVKTLNGLEREAFETSIVEGKKVSIKGIRAKLCAASPTA